MIGIGFEDSEIGVVDGFGWIDVHGDSFGVASGEELG